MNYPNHMYNTFLAKLLLFTKMSIQEDIILYTYAGTAVRVNCLHNLHHICIRKTGFSL